MRIYSTKLIMTYKFTIFQYNRQVSRGVCWTVPWSKWIPLTSDPVFKIHFKIVFASAPGLSIGGLFPSVF